MFTPQERLIYKCPVTERFYDPLAVKRALTSTSRGRFSPATVALRGAAAELDALAKRPDADPTGSLMEKWLVARAEAEQVILAAGRSAFGLAPVDPATGKGVLDATVMDAVAKFTEWLLGKGETARSGPTSAPCTDCRPAD